MKTYKTIIFDLFGTLVHFDEKRLPSFNFQDEEIYCTTLPLYEIASRIQNGYSVEFFHQSLKEIITRIRGEKSIFLKEISCLTRMKTLLNHLHFPEDEKTEQLAIQMKDTHMDWMKKCVYLPAGHRALLERLTPFYQLGLLSNFDDTHTGYRILEELQVDHFFHSILFSEEAGLIKPNPQIFNTILTKLNVDPQDVLFVGDTPEADIIGPKRIGMDTAWVNPEEYPFPEYGHRPDYEIRKITELESIIHL